ncbi:hypothetical protein SMACR_05627 [Sordaria macrospora]|uniref:Rhodopsin domain-containing protein n=1 Tax=Sordaria macrospora TaxID=5147 RepID=A0A8S8ZQD0_SORMA|nr:hypothetical protein SMACR_05627 [Sordaria macrospora]KAH7625529.1 hypothetical protein B0T09DRAFT_64831 [Sordaria sp. MPI-SDFR-AT-0083]WPJ62502.1 hypothetical protein SMAC4_05627 [Sordaria macrospora]
MDSADAPDNTRHGYEMLGVNLGSWALAFIAVALRAYTRLWLRRDCFGTDDILMFISMACFTTYAAFAMSGLVQGSKTDDYAISTSNSVTEAKKFWWACYHAYALTILFAKLSVSWFLLRLTTINKIHRYIIYGSVVIAICNSTAFVFFTIFQCTPVSYFWDDVTQPGQCVRPLVAEYVCSALNIVTDLVCALLPAWIIYHLKIRLRTRIALMTLMGMGCFASCAVIVRMTYFKLQIENSSSTDLSDTMIRSNSVPLIANIAIWSSVEQSLAITAGSLATLRPLLKKVGRKLGFASGTTGSTYDIEHGPRGPPVVLKDRANSLFSRKGLSGPTGSDAVLLETTTAVSFDGAHYSRHVVVTRTVDKTPSLEGDQSHSDSTSSWPPKT